MAGFDTLYDNRYHDRGIAEISGRSGRIYWEGSHWQRMRERFAELLP